MYRGYSHWVPHISPGWTVLPSCQSCHCPYGGENLNKSCASSCCNQMLRAFKCNLEAAAAFIKRLQHLSNILAELAERAVEVQSRLLSYYLQRMDDVVADALK
jgi:hypothetical protein